MTLLSGIRNLIARRREPANRALAVDPEPVEIETGLQEVIEAKPAETTSPAPPEVAVAADAYAEVEDDTELMDIDDLDDLEEPDEIDLADRLDEMETRLDAGGADIHRLVKELDGHVESNAARSQDLVQQLDERIQSQARETQQVVKKLDERIQSQARETQQVVKKLDERIQSQARETQQVVKLGERFELVADESKRLAEQVQQLPALADQVADISRQCNHLRELIDEAAKVATHTEKRSESLVHDLRHLEERTAGFDDAITRVGQSMRHLEATFPVLLERTRKSMLMFVFACMALAVLGICGAIAAMLM